MRMWCRLLLPRSLTLKAEQGSVFFSRSLLCSVAATPESTGHVESRPLLQPLRGLLDNLSISGEEWNEKWGTMRGDEPGGKIRRGRGRRHVLNMEQNLALLSDWGLDKDGQRRLVLATYSVARLNPKVFQGKLEWLVNDLKLKKQDAVKAVKIFPSYFQYAIEDNISQFFNVFKKEGHPIEVIRRMVIKYPRMLGHHKKYKELVAAFQQHLSLTESQVIALIVKFPKIFTYSFERNVLPNMRRFLELGLTEQELRDMVEDCPSILAGRNFEKSFKTKVDWLQEKLGLTLEESLDVLKTTPTTFFPTTSCWEESTDFFLSLGLNKAELVEFLRQDFSVLGRRALGSQVRLDFARNVLKRSEQEILAHPVYFAVPFENSMLLRVAFLQLKGIDITKIPLGELCGMDSAVLFAQYGAEDEFLPMRRRWELLERTEKLRVVEEGFSGFEENSI